MCLSHCRKGVGLLLWCKAVNVKVKPAPECQQLPLQAHLSWKEQWQWNIGVPEKRSYQVKCSVKWVWKTGLSDMPDKIMDLWEKNVVLFLFPSRWPLSQMLPGRVQADLTSPPTACHGSRVLLWLDAPLMPPDPQILRRIHDSGEWICAQITQKLCINYSCAHGKLILSLMSDIVASSKHNAHSVFKQRCPKIFLCQ